MKSRKIFKVACFLTAIIFAVTSVGCQTGTTQSAVSSNVQSQSGSTAAAKTIRIGFTGSLTGNAAAMGADARDALLLWAEENKNKIAGYDIQLFVEDDADDAATTLTKVKKLYEQDKIDVLIAPQNAGGAAAIRDYVLINHIPLILYYAPLDAFTKSLTNPFVVRTGLSASQGAQAMGDYMAKQGFKTCAMISYDFTFGYELTGGFQATFEAAGGKVISKQFTPIGTADFAPLLTNVPLDKIDVLFYHFGGGDAVRFAKQLVDSGINKKVVVVSGYNGTDEMVISQLPLGLADNTFYSVMAYAPTLDNPINKALQASFMKKYNRVASGHTENVYTAMTVLEKGLATGVDFKDGKALIDAIRALKNIAAARGTILGFDEYGQVITPVIIRQLKVVDTKLANIPIKTIENVSQFWTWTAKDFLARPVYSKTYPPVSK